MIDDREVRLAAFKIGDEEYVIDLRRVREIILPRPVTIVRQSPAFVQGVINLRGIVIPIIDMRERFGLEEIVSMPHRRVVIITVDGRTLGIVVDCVTEVIRQPISAIRVAPKLLASTKVPFFLGVSEYHGRSMILLNVRGLIDSDAMVEITTSKQLMEKQ